MRFVMYYWYFLLSLMIFLVQHFAFSAKVPVSFLLKKLSKTLIKLKISTISNLEFLIHVFPFKSLRKFHFVIIYEKFCYSYHQREIFAKIFWWKILKIFSEKSLERFPENSVKFCSIENINWKLRFVEQLIN